MTKHLTAGQMRSIEQAAIKSGSTTGLELMERAGQGVVAGILSKWPEYAQGRHRATVICGPGNNGGDGFVVARLLKEKDWRVSVFLFGDPAKLPPDAATNYERWQGLGSVAPLADFHADISPSPDLVIDAVFGTGLMRPIGGELLDLAIALNANSNPCKKVAIDIPTGIETDTGQILGGAIHADLTITFHAEKRGHRIGLGPNYCGQVVAKDIGLSNFQEISPPEA